MKQQPQAAVEDGEFGDKKFLLTLDGKRVVSLDTLAEATDAARRINAILGQARVK